VDVGINRSIDAERGGGNHDARMNVTSLAPLFAGLRAALNLVMVGLVGFVIAREAIEGGTRGQVAIALALLFLSIYAVGGLQLGQWQARSTAWVGVWLAALTALALALIWITPNAAYLVFPLFFLYLYALPGLWGVAAVAVSTCLMFAVLAIEDRLTTGGVIGPIVAASIAVTIGLGYRALYWESQERQRLIDELVETRGELAEREREAGVLAERARLAREIHDTVAQGLSSIQMLLHAAERADPGRPGIEHVQLARETAARNLDEARRFIHELTPAALEDQTLASALERLARSTVDGNGGLQVEVRVSGESVPVPMQVETALFRLAQGALANVVQHAEAARATITLTHMDDAVSLDVVDDGRGFDPDDLSGATAGRSFGLVAMRERVATLGGTISIESAPGKGTAVAITFGLER
jgi:signal transduction histidine kinase